MTLALFAFLPLWGTLLVGGAAVAIPVVIHLLNRRRYRIVTWAAMRFLLAAQKETTRRLRLEQLILLLVRTAIVLGVVLAMACATEWAEAIWQSIFPAAAGYSGGRGGRTHTIIVLDGSLSMAAAERQGKSGFEKARGMAEQLINDMQSGDAVSILLMKESPVWVVGEASQNQTKLLKELRAVRQPHGNSNVPAALNALAAKLGESAGRFDAREIYFLTDLQQTSWIPDVSPGKEPDKDGGQAKTLAAIQKHARSIFVDLGRDNVDNLAVTSLRLSDTLFVTNANVTVTAQVKNFGKQPRNKLNVSLLVGRWPHNMDKLQLKQIKTELRDLQPGEEVAVNFVHKFPAAGTYAVQVAIDEDELRQDDRRTVIVQVKDTVPVLLVNGKPATKLFDQAAEYLKFALNPVFKKGAPPVSPLRPRVVNLGQFSDANQTNLHEYDCVFLCDVGQLKESEVKRLEAYVRSGGGLVITAGDNVAKYLDSYNRLLYKNDQGLLPAKLLGVQGAPKEHYFWLHAPEGFDVLPLRAFLNETDQLSLRNVRFHQYLRTQPANDAAVRKVLSFRPERYAGSTVDPGLTLPVDEAALLEWNPPAPGLDRNKPKTPKEKGVAGLSRSRGKVLLLTSTVNMDWTSWPGSPSFLAMMQELTRYAVSGRLREQSTLVDGVLEEYFAGGGELDGTLVMPGGEPVVKFRTQPADDLSVFRWTETDQSGVYRMTVGQDPQEYLFAVNVPMRVPDRKTVESDLTRADKAKLKSAYPGWEFQVVKELDQVQHTGGVIVDEADGKEKREPKRIGPRVAHFLLLFTLLLLFAEIGLASCFGRYSATATALQQGPRVRPVPFFLGLFLAAGSLLFLLLLCVAVVEYTYSHDFLGFALPDSFRGWIESLLDVPPPAPGESTQWTLQVGPPLADPDAPLYFVVFKRLYPFILTGTLGLAVMSLLIAALFDARSGSPLPMLAGIGALSLTTIALTATWLLLQPEIVFQRLSWPDVVLLIDDSRSMGAADPYRDEQAREPVTRLAERYKKYVTEKTPGQINALREQLDARRLQLAKKPGDAVLEGDVGRLEGRLKVLQDQLSKVSAPGWRPTRLQLAQAIMLGTGGDNDWLAALSKKNRLKIHIFHLDASGQALKLTDASGNAADVIEPGELDHARQNIAALHPVGNDSQLGKAVRQVIDYYRGSALCGVVMFTDGVTTQDENLVKVSEYAAQKGIPLYFVGIGEDREKREIELHDLQVEDPVFVNDRLIFEARLSGTGYKDLTIPVVLKVKEGSAEKELARELVKLDPNGKSVKVRLKHQPTEPGQKTFVVEALVPKAILDELPAGGHGKRRLEREIFVQENKLIRALYIEGSARWDFRYVKNLLERETLEKKGNKTIDLKVLLLDSDEGYSDQYDNVLAEFPPNKQLLYQYDVIIVGDADPRARKLGEPRLRDLADFVKERGGGLLFIAGSQFNPHAYKDTPLAGVLPIDLTKAPVEPEDRTEGYRIELTAGGRLHPIFRFVPDEAENMKVWQNLMPMYWWAEGYRPKPLAEVLAVHPKVKAEGPIAKGQDDRHPLVVQLFMGAGRSMFFGFDETWRWRYREDELRFNQFWIQAVRYLARSKLARTELRLDRQSAYEVGQPIKVTVRFPNPAAVQPGAPDAKGQPPAKVIVQVEFRPKGAAKGEIEIQTLQLAKVEGTWATFEGTLTRTRAGEYQFSLIQPDVSKQQPNGKRPSASAIVEQPPGEEDIRFHPAEMIQAAAASRTPAELETAKAAGRKNPGYYSVSEADLILEDLSLETVAATGQLVPYSPRRPWPVWNHFLTFSGLISLLTSVWVLRKSVNLL
jgi:hypothetical protein